MMMKNAISVSNTAFSGTAFSGIYIRRLIDREPINSPSEPKIKSYTTIRVMMEDDERGNHLQAFQKDLQTKAQEFSIHETEGKEPLTFWSGGAVDFTQKPHLASVFIGYLDQLKNQLMPETYTRLKDFLQNFLN
jgi:hypothetical protein